MKELIAVSKGDMRKCINLLQSVYLSVNWGQIDGAARQTFRGGSGISVKDFYKMIGSISPEDISRIFQVLTTEGFVAARTSCLISNQTHPQ